MFSLQYLNERTSTFEYCHHDKKNKIQLFKVFSGQTFKIKQTECEMWNLLRLFPLLVALYVNEGDPLWELLLSCFFSYN